MIEIRMRTPGLATFMVQNFDDFMSNAGGLPTYVVRNQKEKDTLDGYALIYGNELKIVVGPHDVVSLYGSAPYFFLWVVEIEELS